MNKPKNIIFDLGNVILNIDYNLPVIAFKKLGIANFQEIFSQASQNTLSDDFECGLVDEHFFIEEIKKRCAPNTTTQQVIDAWNSIIINFPIRRLQILQQLQLYYNTYLLSNTNIIHEKFYNHALQNTCGFPSIAVFFEKIYLSHHINMRKPNPQTWQKILDENNLQASETLFLDDSIQHIEAAKKLGIQAIHITPDNPMESIFRQA